MSSSTNSHNLFNGNHKVEKLGTQKDKIMREVEVILSQLSPEDLKKFAFLDKNLKKIVEKIQTDKESECLELLKKLAKLEKPSKKGLLSRIYQMSTSLLMGQKNGKENRLAVCGNHVTSMDLSLDQATVDNPNPVLKIMGSHCKRVDTLILNSCNIDEEGFDSLFDMPQLKLLSLSFCNHLNEIMIEKLSQLSQIKELKLNWNGSLPLQALPSLANLQNLELLDLSHTNITDNELKYVGQLTHLKVLNLDDCQKITDKGIKHLNALNKLHSLNLSSPRITDQGLKELVQQFPQIASMTLRNNQFSDAAATELSHLKELVYLDLSWSRNLGGSFLNALSSLEKLKILNLSRSIHINPKEISWRNFKNLMYLNLSFTKVDDETLEEISFMPLFTGASFSHSQNITLKGVEFLANAENLHYIDLTHTGFSYEDVSPLFPPDVDIRV